MNVAVAALVIENCEVTETIDTYRLSQSDDVFDGLAGADATGMEVFPDRMTFAPHEVDDLAVTISTFANLPGGEKSREGDGNDHGDESGAQDERWLHSRFRIGAP